MRSVLLMLGVAALFSGASVALPHEAMNTGAVTVATTSTGLRSPLPFRARLKDAYPLSSAAAAGSRTALVQAALDAVLSRVTRQSDPNALRYAFQAYFNFKAAHPEQVRNPYLYFVDYGLDNRTPRGYVFDMDAMQVVDGPFTVAHGRGSSEDSDGVPTSFSNQPGSAATSLGLFLTDQVYAFTGHSDGELYHSIGLRLRGVSGGFNSTAFDRGVVAHGAPYVTPDRAGRSEGCPAMEPDRAERLLPMISNGGLVFLFSPLDQEWLQKEPWTHTSDAKVALTE